MVRGCLKNKMLTSSQQKVLLDIALQSIQYGLNEKHSFKPELSDFDSDLQQKKATFVTLKKNDQLRGCIGILQATRTLVEDVYHNAYAAAFQDSRFAPVTGNELDQLSVHISILSPSSKMMFDSEQELIDQIQIGIDGIILEDTGRKATFLPSVWEQLNDKKELLKHLKLKAGLPADHWSDTLKVSRYSVESF